MKLRNNINTLTHLIFLSNVAALYLSLKDIQHFLNMRITIPTLVVRVIYRKAKVMYQALESCHIFARDHEWKAV